jgi:4-hydroxy-tetrahydrodipicolinate synthase
MASLHGVFPVLPTPFAPDGAPDEAAFARLVDFACAAGVQGVVYPGMASEVETLTPAERAAMVAALGRHLAGRLPFIVGASDADPARAAERAREGVAAGAVAAMVMAPPGAGQDVARHAAFFATLAAGVPGLPIMLQNAPPPNGAGLPPDAVAAVCRAVPAIRFVKEETLPCGQHVSRILAATGGSLDGVLGGAGARFVMDELARGACGTMPALEVADAHARLWALFRAGDVAGARRIYDATLPLLCSQMVFRVRVTKEVLRRRGLLAHTAARAAGPVPDAADLAEIAALLATAAPVLPIALP